MWSLARVAKDLMEVLTTYHYERATAQMAYHYSNGRRRFSFFPHRHNGITVGQARTLEDRKALFEQDELVELEKQGIFLIWDGSRNKTFPARPT